MTEVAESTSRLTTNDSRLTASIDAQGGASVAGDGRSEATDAQGGASVAGDRRSGATDAQGGASVAGDTTAGMQEVEQRMEQLPRRSGATDAIDRRIIVATQAGLPLARRPYHLIAAQLGIDPQEVMIRLRRMLKTGVIRRIGVVPNHYALGYHANGMSVWDVPDDKVEELGRKVGDLDFVSHCYRRPRHLPDWPYNLFAMVHERNDEEVDAKVARIAELLGQYDRRHTVLYSTRILKKTGLRLSDDSGVQRPEPKSTEQDPLALTPD